jgi:hypothetical protein
MNLLETYLFTKNDSDKESYHKYITNFYNDKFAKYKNKNLNILEIGVLYGSSLKLWEDYFPNAKIFGVDIQNAVKYNYSERVKILIDNAYSDSFLTKIKNFGIKFDIIIEDGPHTLETQSFFLEKFEEILKEKDSLMILEDVYPHQFETLKNRFQDFNIIDLRPIIQGENNSVIFYKEK